MGGGVYDYGNPRAWGDSAFWKFRRQGGLKYGSCAWYGMDIFWNRPLRKLGFLLIISLEIKFF